MKLMCGESNCYCILLSKSQIITTCKLEKKECIFV